MTVSNKRHTKIERTYLLRQADSRLFSGPDQEAGAPARGPLQAGPGEVVQAVREPVHRGDPLPQQEPGEGGDREEDSAESQVQSD